VTISSVKVIRKLRFAFGLCFVQRPQASGTKLAIDWQEIFREFLGSRDLDRQGAGHERPRAASDPTQDLSEC